MILMSFQIHHFLDQPIDLNVAQHVLSQKTMFVLLQYLFFVIQVIRNGIYLVVPQNSSVIYIMKDIFVYALSICPLNSITFLIKLINLSLIKIYERVAPAVIVSLVQQTYNTTLTEGDLYKYRNKVLYSMLADTLKKPYRSLN